MTQRYVRLIGTFFQPCTKNMPNRNSVTVKLLRELVSITTVIRFIFTRNIIVQDHDDNFVNTIPLISKRLWLKSSWIWCCVTGQVVYDVSKDCRALNKIENYSPHNTASHPRRLQSPATPSRDLKSQIIKFCYSVLLTVMTTRKVFSK